MSERNLILASMLLIALAMTLVFQRRRAARLSWRRVVFYVGERLTASFPVLADSPVCLAIRHTGSDSKVLYEYMRIAYGPHNVVRIASEEKSYYIGLRDAEHGVSLPSELNLRVFDQICHVSATHAQLTVAVEITRPPTRPAQAMAAVHPQLKIIARRAA